jgi:hypothetical protein
MKIWPIITMVGLVWGSFYADSQNVGRESKPHFRGHFTHEGNLDAEVADDMKDFGRPHRVATGWYQSFFAKMLADETEWSAPEGNQVVTTDGDTNDDGEDPGKKLFWTTNHPDNVGVPFTGWFDPTAEPTHPLMPAYPGTLPPGCCDYVFYYIIDDPQPPKLDENMATTAALHSLQLPFGALKALNNLIVTINPGEPPVVTIMPCETIIVNGVCPMPCKGNDDPLCKDDPLPPPVVVDPGNPTDPGTPPVIIGGGGGGSPVGGGSVGSVGGVPEPSTWFMLITGFGAMAFFGWRRSLTNTESEGT